MFDQATRAILEWVSAACPQWAVEAGIPVAPADPPTIRVTLLDILPAMDRAQGALARSHLRARYMVTAVASDPLVAHEGLGRVAAEAAHREATELQLHASDPALWAAFGVPPQPALYLQVSVVLPKDDDPAQPVTQPIDVQMVPLTALSGRLVGPTGKGISGAQVRLDGQDTRTKTDARGAFTLDGVPARGGSAVLVISSGSGQMRADVVLSDDPVLITYQPEGV